MMRHGRLIWFWHLECKSEEDWVSTYRSMEDWRWLGLEPEGAIYSGICFADLFFFQVLFEIIFEDL